MEMKDNADTGLALDIQRLVHGKILEGTTLHKRGSFVVTVGVEMFLSLHKLLDPSFQYQNEEDVTREVISKSLRSLANVMDKEIGRPQRSIRSKTPSNSGIRLASANTLPSNVALLSQPSYNNCPPLMLRPTLERYSIEGMMRRQVVSTPSSFAPADKEDTFRTLADVFRDIAEQPLPDIKAMLSNIVSCTRSSQASDKQESSSTMVNVSELITNYIIEYGTTNQGSSSQQLVCRFCSGVYRENSVEKGSSCCRQAAKLRKTADEWHLLRKAPFHQGFVKWDAFTMADILDNFQSHITCDMTREIDPIEPTTEAQWSTAKRKKHEIAKKRRTRKLQIQEKMDQEKIKPYDSKAYDSAVKDVAEIPLGETEEEIRVTNFCQSDKDGKETGSRISEATQTKRALSCKWFITPSLRPTAAVRFNRPLAACLRRHSEIRALMDKVKPNTISDGFISHVTDSDMLSYEVSNEHLSRSSSGVFDWHHLPRSTSGPPTTCLGVSGYDLLNAVRKIDSKFAWEQSNESPCSDIDTSIAEDVDRTTCEDVGDEFEVDNSAMGIGHQEDEKKFMLGLYKVTGGKASYEVRAAKSGQKEERNDVSLSGLMTSSGINATKSGQIGESYDVRLSGSTASYDATMPKYGRKEDQKENYVKSSCSVTSSGVSATKNGRIGGLYDVRLGHSMASYDARAAKSSHKEESYYVKSSSSVPSSGFTPTKSGQIEECNDLRHSSSMVSYVARVAKSSEKEEHYNASLTGSTASCDATMDKSGRPEESYDATTSGSTASFEDKVSYSGRKSSVFKAPLLAVASSRETEAMAVRQVKSLKSEGSQLGGQGSVNKLEQLSSPMQQKMSLTPESRDSDTDNQRTSRTSRKNSMLHMMRTCSRRSRRGLRTKSKQRRIKPLDEQRQLHSAKRNIEEVFRQANLSHKATINTMIVQLHGSFHDDVSESDADVSDSSPGVTPRDAQFAGEMWAETPNTSESQAESPDPSRILPSDATGKSLSPKSLNTPPHSKRQQLTTYHLPVSVSMVAKILNSIARFIQSKRTVSNCDCWSELRELLIDPSVRHRITNETWIEISNMLFPELQGTTKHITYQAIPAHPHFSWFRPRDQDEVKLYRDGNKFSVFHKDGSGRIFYPDGVLAIELITKERGSRYMVYSPATKHVVPSLSKESVLIAMFDLHGNGVIYDTDGSVRLHYTQREGVMLDSTHGMPVIWTWPVNYVQDDPFSVLANELFSLTQDPEQTALDELADLPIFPDIDDSKKDLIGKMSKANKERSMSGSLIRRANMPSIPTMESFREETTQSSKEGVVTRSNGVITEAGSNASRGTALLSPRVDKESPDISDRSWHSARSGEMDANHERTKVNFQASVNRTTRPSVEVASRARSGDVGSASGKETWKEIWLPVATEDETYESERDRVAKWKSRYLRPDMCAHYPQIPLKINDFMSFRLSGQADVALIFSAEKLSLRIELGVVVNPTSKVRVDLFDSKTWPVTRIPACNLERFPPTRSLAVVGESVEERRRRKQERDSKRAALERRLGLRN